MLSRTPKSVLLSGAILGALGLIYLACARPEYFTSQTYLGGLILLEVLIAAIWQYRHVFFTLLILVFLLAGTGLPGSSIWTSARWLFLAVGALVGFLILLLKGSQHCFGMFHTMAFFAVLAATVSAMVSRHPDFALLKVLSLFLLFMYAASGARLAVRGRETRFFAGLLLGCELLIASLAISDLLFHAEVMGNPNSLGAIAGVVCAPMLLWGSLVADSVATRRRRLFVYVICMYLVYYSQSRASVLAATFSCALLFMGLRRYRALITAIGIALVLVSTAVILRPERVFETASTVGSELVYKNLQKTDLLASRQSTWQEAVDTIHSHFWFGTGFGTADKENSSDHLEKFSSSSEAKAEYGSSYLKILAWVGVLGVWPFVLLLLVLIGKVLQTVLWMLHTGNPSHPAIPLAMVVVAGMVHAIFEDWMFAPGYYLCVFYWCMAFVLIDMTPVQMVAPVRGRAELSARWLRAPLDAVAPTR